MFLCSDGIHLTFEPVLRFLINCLLSLATTPSIRAYVRHSPCYLLQVHFLACIAGVWKGT